MKKKMKKTTPKKATKGKTKGKTKEKKATLRTVSDRAMTDPAFWKSLRNDPRKALDDNGMTLAPTAYARLTDILALDGKTLRVDLDALMKLLGMDGPKDIGGLSWIMMWPGKVIDPPQQ